MLKRLCSLFLLVCIMIQYTSLIHISFYTPLPIYQPQYITIPERVTVTVTEIVKYYEDYLASLPSAFGIRLSYEEKYHVAGAKRLNKGRGAVYFNGHKETYYSQKVLPGAGLKIPGRHVAKDGTIRDQDGYICVAADPSYLSKHSIVLTSLGPAKVYDTGCAYGTIDIYVNW